MEFEFATFFFCLKLVELVVIGDVGVKFQCYPHTRKHLDF